MEFLRKVWLFLIDTIQSIVIAASIFLIIYFFLIRPYKVDGLSMFPNFQNGEYVLTNLIDLRFHDLKRGDVIVFKAPPSPDKDYIKRIIGLPGDSVSVNNGDVYLNNQRFDESLYLKSDVKTFGFRFLLEGDTKIVPENNYFVMGDNRPESSDSRDWGFVPRGNVIGKSFFVYWPPQNMRSIKNPFGN